MEKRLIIAIGLSLLILLSWSAMTSKMHHIENKEVMMEVSPIFTAPPLPIKDFEPSKTSSSATSLKCNQEQYEIIFDVSQAAIQKAVFKQYQSSAFSLGNGLLLGGPEMIFAKSDSLSGDKAVTFVYVDKDKRVSKRFICAKENYTIELELDTENLSGAPLEVKFPLILGGLNFAEDPQEARFQDVTIDSNGRAFHLNARKDASFDNARLLGLRNRYFCAIIEPIGKDNYIAWVRKINPKKSEAGLMLPKIKLDPGENVKQKFRIYLGPQVLGVINKINPNWSSVMHYGTFNIIANVLVQTLEGIYRIVHNWGWAIIVLSLLIYLLLFPLTLKQMRSMKEMQVLQPRIEELRKMYKDNPQKLNKEIMELYKEHKVNPLSGCLPLLLQMPIFFALYQVLIRAIALKGAPFLWIKDLSAPDRLIVLGNNIEINILPILMALGMFVQQKLTMPSTVGVANEQQKLMTIIMPVMFGFIFYRMPAGLVLYWFINSALMLLYQLKISRKL